MSTPILHLTRGPAAVELDKARSFHNEFVGTGPQPGIEIARSLGDIGHVVLANTEPTASPELLFLDLWVAGEGMETFFANPFAQEAGDRLFSAREESEWHRLATGFDYHVPMPDGLAAAYFSILRAPVAADATTEIAEAAYATVAAARRIGQLSHALYLRRAAVIAERPATNARYAGGESVEQPGADAEILVLGSWSDPSVIRDHYRTFGEIEALAGPADLTIWRRAPGFIEWSRRGDRGPRRTIRRRWSPRCRGRGTPNP